MSKSPLGAAPYNSPCFVRRAGIAALDSANISWRLAYTTASLQSLWAGVAAGLGITLRTAVGLPSSLKPLGEREGLPALPTVELCLHTGHGDAPPALQELKQVVVENAMANLGVQGAAQGRHLPSTL